MREEIQPNNLNNSSFKESSYLRLYFLRKKWQQNEKIFRYSKRKIKICVSFKGNRFGEVAASADYLLFTSQL